MKAFSVSVTGIASTSAANLLMIVFAARNLPISDFGLLSFSLVIIQFYCGLSNALLGTPYAVQVNATESTSRIDQLFFSFNPPLAIMGGITCATLALFNGTVLSSFIIGLFATGSILRWFWRSWYYARGEPTAAAISDALYAIALGVSAAVCALTSVTLETVGAAYLASTVFSCLPLRHVLLVQCRNFLSPIRPYVQVWREQSRWALMGVLTTEATSNAHAWIISLTAGPGAFAPLAVATLLFRPLGVCAAALTQLERPNLVRKLVEKNFASAYQIHKRFRHIMLVGWVGTTCVAWLIITLQPGIVIHEAYDMTEVRVAVAIWTGISLSQALRSADSTLLQAANRFRALAMASLYSGALTVISVGILMQFHSPATSTIGVLVGQLVMATLISLALKKSRLGHD